MMRSCWSIVDQNLVGIDAVVSALMLSTLMNIRKTVHYVKTCRHPQNRKQRQQSSSELRNAHKNLEAYGHVIFEIKAKFHGSSFLVTSS